MMRCAQPLTGKAGRVLSVFLRQIVLTLFTLLSLSLTHIHTHTHTHISLLLSLPPYLKRSAQDEQLIEAAINAGPPDGHMFIYDARSSLAAIGNQMMVSNKH